MLNPDANIPTLVDFAKFISASFWNRIHFARTVRQRRLRVSEITLTEELVFQFFILAAHKILPAKVFQSTDEKANGSDLEILLELDNAIIKLPCQAKIVYATRRYGALYHRVGGQFQIDLLLRHAKKIGGYPIYMLYNYDPYMTPQLLKIAGGNQQFWGCSIGCAHQIKKKFFIGSSTPPMFHDLHPEICWPFYKIFEPLNSKDAGKYIASLLNGFNVNSLRKYSIEEILNDESFTDLTSSDSLGYVSHFEKALLKFDVVDLREKDLGFNPRFRILFTDDIIRTGSLQFLD